MIIMIIMIDRGDIESKRQKEKEDWKGEIHDDVRTKRKKNTEEKNLRKERKRNEKSEEKKQKMTSRLE